MSLRIVASLVNWSDRLDTRSSSSLLASANIFTRAARSPSSAAFNAPDFHNEPFANVLQLLDELHHAALVGFQRNKTRLQLAEPRLQLSEDD